MFHSQEHKEKNGAKKKMKKKKKTSGALVFELKLMIKNDFSIDGLNCEIEVKGKRKISSLFTFFHLFRQSPPKKSSIQIAAVTLTLPP